jgi:ubiquinone/menaquinone biosynthesis C-methylase UbiE
MTRFLQIIAPQPTERILDVGGTAYNWELIGYKNEVVLLNLTLPRREDLPKNFSLVVGDGTALQYGNKEYDILFSNSVIEHVGTLEKQRDFAHEVCRVGKRVWIQTPAKEFFFEPHYLTPFIHWLSKDLQKKLLRNFSVWGIITRPKQQDIDMVVEQTRLLSFSEMREIFHGCTIIKEKFLFMTKSYVVVKT